MPRRRGFTLIELLVVLTIIALLFGIGMTAMKGVQGRGKEATTEGQIQTLKGLFEQYRNATGDYPPSMLSKLGVRSSNTLYEGNEAMVLALAAKTYTGPRIEESNLKNLDDDSADKNISSYPNPVLLEVVDAWEQPFVYIRYDAYGTEQEYEFNDPATGEKQAVKVKALKNPLTGGYYDPESYQLISCGDDGVFGTDDDKRSFSIAN